MLYGQDDDEDFDTAVVRNQERIRIVNQQKLLNDASTEFHLLGALVEEWAAGDENHVWSTHEERIARQRAVADRCRRMVARLKRGAT